MLRDGHALAQTIRFNVDVSSLQNTRRGETVRMSKDTIIR